jgi:hypothetical protein
MYAPRPTARLRHRPRLARPIDAPRPKARLRHRRFARAAARPRPGRGYWRPAQAGIFERCSRAAFSASGRGIFFMPMK